MALLKNRISLAAASLAALSMTAAPLSAAQLPQIGAASAYDAGALDAQHGRRHRDRGGIDTGDVIAGVLVLGAIAAIASEASRDDDDDRVRYREPQRRDASWSSGGMDRAVDMCVGQVERGRDRVDSVDNASRDASGWNVDGTLRSGDYFSCRIDNNGRIRSVDVGEGYGADYDPAGYSSADGQLSDEAYARARAATRYRDPVEPIDADLGADGPRPAYPGGPLPGEEGYEDGWGG